MYKIYIDEGRELSNDECVDIAKKRGMVFVFMVEHCEDLNGDINTLYKITGW